MTLRPGGIQEGFWRRGAKIRNWAKRRGVLGFMETPLLSLAKRFARPPADDTVLTTPQGIVLTIPPGVLSGITYTAGEYEPEVVSLIDSTLHPGMGVVDVGANVGYLTLLMARQVGPSGTVFAFEPDPTVADALSRNIKANNLSNVVVASVAVSDREGVVGLTIDPFHAESYLSRSDPGSLKVRTTSLDTFFAEKAWPSIDFIKVDAEGSELSILAGVAEVSRRNPGLRMVVEINPAAMRRAGTNPREMLAALGQLGFVWGQVVERNAPQFPLVRGLPRSRGVYNLLVAKA